MAECKFCKRRIGFFESKFKYAKFKYAKVKYKSSRKYILLCYECYKKVNDISNSWVRLENIFDRNKRMQNFDKVSSFPRDIVDIMTHNAVYKIKLQEKCVDVTIMHNKEALGYKPIDKPLVRLRQTKDKMFYFDNKPEKLYYLQKYEYIPDYNQIIETDAVFLSYTKAHYTSTVYNEENKNNSLAHFIFVNAKTKEFVEFTIKCDKKLDTLIHQLNLSVTPLRYLFTE